jgi:tripartite-type tricarboxylate transporter receptor subunit TctC
MTSTLVAACIGLAPCMRAQADEVADFYKGKVINVVIAFSAGGGYDLYARLLAKHMGKFIPGNPTLVPQNMPGAGTLKATKYLYAVAPKDGTTIGIFSRSMPLAPVLGLQGADFDATKFTWLGSITKDTITCVSWHTSKIKSWDDTLQNEYRVGGEGKGSDPDLYATLIKSVLNAKAKLVTGYPGTADIVLAMERKELDGLCGISYSTLKGRHAAWLASKEVTVIVQAALEKDPGLPNVPTMLELAKTGQQKEVLKLLLAAQAMARPFVAPPQTPPARAAALRAAFDATMKDPAFLAEAARLQLDVDPMSGDKIQKLLTELYATPKNVAAMAAQMSGF